MKTDEIEKTEKTASGDYLRMLTCYVIWGFQPLYFHLKPDIDGLFLLMSRIFWGCVLVTTVVSVSYTHLDVYKRQVNYSVIIVDCLI